ncbi:hypothetical protein DVH24_035584, partial [Malus domestica]
LREGPNRKLVANCNGEGILLVKASGDVTLEQLGDKILPLVTRLTCGGFILHCAYTMCDAPGLLQFLKAIAEM